MSQNSAYFLEITEKGVFLTVYSLPKTDLTQMHIIEQEIVARNIENVDWKEVKQANRFKSKKYKIAPPQMTSKNDGVLVIDISDDQMKAYAILFPPLSNGRPVTKDVIMVKLNDAGIKYGIDHKMVQELCTAQKYTRCCIAQGRQPQKGRDAVIEYNFDVSQDLFKPQVTDDGRVDFYNLNVIQNVVEGQVLARKIPAVPGISGVTVTGKKVNPPRPRDIPLNAGKNTILNNNGFTLIATISGHAILKAGRVSVLPVFEVAGDVDLSTGNIDFVGSVRVLGNVKPGFVIKAEGDVEVNRAIDGGFVKAGGSIMVKGGVLGRGKGHIKACGSIYAKFFENVNVEAGHTVVAGEAIMHSIIKAGRKITVKGRKGKIIGGLCFAGEDIEGKVIGSPLAVNTQLEIGVSSQAIADLKALSLDEIEITEQLQKLNEMIMLLKSVEEPKKYLQGRDPASLITTQQNLLAKLETVKEKKNEILARFQLLEQGRVRVQECIYPGAVVTFGNLSYYIREEMQHICFYKEGDNIKTAPY